MPAPSDPALFTPDLYPAGPPLAPATQAPTHGQVVGDLWALGEGAVGWHVDGVLAERVPDPDLRAGVAALDATIGAPLLPWLTSDDCLVESIAWGDPGGDRIAGLAQPADRETHRVVNERYHHEHPFLATGSLLHQLCWNPGAESQAEEVLLHALLAVAHAQLLLALPSLVGTTELARRQQTQVLTLCNSRPAGRREVQIVAPDGTGTIPGGDPAMQTPDLWSVPFAAESDSVPAPPSLAAVLDPWLTADAVADGVTARISRATIDAVDDTAMGRWLPPSTAAEVLRLLGAG